jgi:predicted alpha/beta-hydrolase family hydrolase
VAIEIETPRGIAVAHVRETAETRAALVLGHGAGGGVNARDLAAAAAAAEEERYSVALVEQPYRVAGRRSPPPAAHLDEAWLAVVGELAAGPLAGLPLVTGGRSSGARVACRTAAATGSIGVLCLAFPLQPPGGRPDRLAELDGVSVPVLVVQGANDPFGIPPKRRRRRVVVVEGDHGLKKDLPAVAAAVRGFLRTLG